MGETGRPEGCPETAGLCCGERQGRPAGNCGCGGDRGLRHGSHSGGVLRSPGRSAVGDLAGHQHCQVLLASGRNTNSTSLL